jgi:hypothetical protein
MATGGKRSQAAVLLAGGATIKHTAAACGIGERTLYGWRKDPAFAARVERLRSRLVELAMSRLCKDLLKAERKLRELLDDPQGKLRLGAIRLVLEGALRLRDLTDLEKRFQALEEFVAAQQERKP